MIALHANAQSEWIDKSPDKGGSITANGIKLHYLDWGGAGETLLAGRIIMTTSHLGSPISFACLDSPGAATANLKPQSRLRHRYVGRGHSAIPRRLENSARRSSWPLAIRVCGASPRNHYILRLRLPCTLTPTKFIFASVGAGSYTLAPNSSLGEGCSPILLACRAVAIEQGVRIRPVLPDLCSLRDPLLKNPVPFRVVFDFLGLPEKWTGMARNSALPFAKCANGASLLSAAPPLL